MGRGSSIPEERKSEYQKRREALGLSRERAAMLMPGMNDDRLERIEKGKVTVTPDDVLTLSDAYKDLELRNYFCSKQCAIGRKYVPAVEVGDLPRIVLELEAALNSFLGKRAALIEIASDGRVSEAEMAGLKSAHAGFNSAGMMPPPQGGVMRPGRKLASHPPYRLKIIG